MNSTTDRARKIIRRSRLYRGDLLRTIIHHPNLSAERIAAFCGFFPEQRASKSAAIETRKKDIQSPGRSPTQGPARKPDMEESSSQTERAHFLFPEKIKILDPDAPGSDGEDWLTSSDGISASELSAKDIPLPPTPPLMSWSRLWPLLRRVLGERREGGRIDIRRIVSQLSSFKPIYKVPKLKYNAWADRAVILMDRRDGLAPFWGDMDRLIRRIDRVRGAEGLDCRILYQGRIQGTTSDQRSGKFGDYRPKPEVPILVISDLGCLDQDTALINYWKEEGVRLRSRGANTTALMPCPRERWSRRLVSLWNSICWDRTVQGSRIGTVANEAGEPVPSRSDEEREHSVGTLLRWLSCGLRIEPGLLRSVRIELGEAPLDVGIEYDVWNHPEVDRIPTAMALRPEAAIRRRRELREEKDQIRKVKILELHKNFHEGCGPTVNLRERLNFEDADLKIPEEEKKAIRLSFRRIVNSLYQVRDESASSAVQELGLLDWVKREIPRVSPEVRSSDETIGAAWAISQFVEFKKGGENAPVTSTPPEGIALEKIAWVQNLLEDDPGIESLWKLSLRGRDLVFLPASTGIANPFTEVDAESWRMDPPLAWIRARRNRLHLIWENHLTGKQSWQITLEPNGGNSLRLGRPLSISCTSDIEKIHFSTIERPGFVRELGRDSFGLFMDLQVQAICFRMRWIPPGRFFMGSPEDEKERRESEQGHTVILSTGFWMAETACTQNLWQAVMGGNPSNRKGDDLPVTDVRWHDVEEFHRKLAQVLKKQGKGSIPFRFPSEAEWEFACRAGTVSAFNNGSACTNPEGKDPALEELGWYVKNSGGQIHPVKQKKPNPWGMYDMHGNVWEWCQDKCDWKAGIITGIYQEGIVDPQCEKGALRVVRGGSAWDHAGLCRSAIRDGGDPASRDGSQGFRLVAGQFLL